MTEKEKRFAELMQARMSLQKQMALWGEEYQKFLVPGTVVQLVVNEKKTNCEVVKHETTGFALSPRTFLRIISNGATLVVYGNSLLQGKVIESD